MGYTKLSGQPKTMNHNISIVLPAFNEADNIGNVIAHVRRLYPDAELIVVDDGSTDDTAGAAVAAGAVVYQHPYNIGNGAAVKTGIRKASGDTLVFMDADGQHDPADIGRLLENMPEYDMVVGARSFTDQASVLRGLGNKIYNWMASYVTNFRVLDLTSGFRAVKAEIARSFIYLLPNTYSYQGAQKK